MTPYYIALLTVFTLSVHGILFVLYRRIDRLMGERDQARREKWAYAKALCDANANRPAVKTMAETGQKTPGA